MLVILSIAEVLSRECGQKVDFDTLPALLRLWRWIGILSLLLP
jgi:hypothetical protein